MRFEARIAARGLGLRRGHRWLVRGLDLDVAPGEAVELRGPNGSGKTTTLRALAGLHPPAQGTASLIEEAAGDDVERAERLHFLGHLDAVKAAEPAGRQLHFWCAMLGAPKAMANAAADRMGLTRQWDLPGAVLSAGQRRRLALCRLLLAPRPLWLLDEPAAPLDAQGRALLGELLDAHRTAGGIVIAAVHDRLPGRPARRIDLDAEAPG